MNHLTKPRPLQSIRFFLMIGFAVILGLSLLIALIGYISLQNLQNSTEVALNQAVQIRNFSLQIQNDFLHARQYEADFLDNWRILGFDEAENRFVIPHTQAVESAQTQLTALVQLISRNNIPQFDDMDVTVEALTPLLNVYQTTFTDTRQAIQQRVGAGGIEQRLQRHWEALRRYTENLRDSTLYNYILLIKVSEQAYLNTREQAFLDNIRLLALQFEREAPDYFEELPSSTILPDLQTILMQLTEYQGALNELVQLDQNILSNAELGRDVALSINLYTDLLNVRAEALLLQTRLDQQHINTNSTIALVGTSAIAFIVAILVAYVLSRRILIPLRRLTMAAQKVDGGSLDHPPVVVQNKDEFATLADVFNQMTGRLRVFVDELEQIVEVRTHDLSLAKAEAERANKIKSQFLASVSHELRTPLNAILNFTQFVSTGMFGEVNPKQVEMLNIVVDNGRHLLALINDILDVSKIEAGALDLFLEDDVDVITEIDDAIRAGEAILRERDVDVTIQRDFATDMPRITADRRRVRQIMLNLISNACKFTDAGFIRVSAKPDGDKHILLSVQDTGSGIPADDFDNIFENFRQTDAGKRYGGGTGLGLPISRKLAEAHGGKLWLDSVVGSGSTFYVRLPLKALGI
jgi:signal transduction histidine kinase